MREPQHDDRERTQRVLVIDDNRAIHEDIRKILTWRDTALDDMEAALFGEAHSGPPPNLFLIDGAIQGQAGLELIQQAALEARPFGLAIVDLHMPPGWDGLETITRIWQADPEIQIILCAALMEYSREEVVARLGRSEGLALLKKPFEAAAVLGLANAMTDQWRSREEARLHLQA
jgi:CheY-like chemotaxis protein